MEKCSTQSNTVCSFVTMDFVPTGTMFERLQVVCLNQQDRSKRNAAQHASRLWSSVETCPRMHLSSDFRNLTLLFLCFCLHEPHEASLKHYFVLRIHLYFKQDMYTACFHCKHSRGLLWSQASDAHENKLDLGRVFKQAPCSVLEFK